MSEIVKYILVDDEEHVQKIRNGLKRKEEKYGKPYCPCVAPAAHNEDTICPCKNYREKNYCCCKLYKE